MNEPLSLDEFDSKALLVPLAARADVYYSCVALSARRRDAAVRLQGTSVSAGADVALLKSKMELLERAAQWEWIDRDGRSITTFGWTDHLPIGHRKHERPEWGDATGFCAGTDKRRALEHGLLEVFERDAVVRVFDTQSAVSLYRGEITEVARELLRAQKASATVFLHLDDSKPPTAIALIRSESGPGGAVGTACRMTVAGAVSKAILEGVMMLTTARNLERASDPREQFRGVLWASKNIDRLKAELTENAQDADEFWSLRLPLSVIATNARATYSEVPVTTIAAHGNRVWKVHVGGAKSFAHVKREPWPIG